jgi:hypothetical protein
MWPLRGGPNVILGGHCGKLRRWIHGHLSSARALIPNPCIKAYTVRLIPKTGFVKGGSQAVLQSVLIKFVAVS